MSKVLIQNTSRVLLQALKDELAKGLADIKHYAERQTVVTYWKLGRIINDHSAKTGQSVKYDYLSRGLGINVRSLQHCVQFAREYPVLDDKKPITWSHYRFLLTLKTPEERQRWEQRILKENLKTEDLKALLVEDKLQAVDIPVSENPAARGKLYTYRIIKVKDTENLSDGYRVDCGFNIRILPPDSVGKLDNTRIIQTRKDEQKKYTAIVSDATSKDIYTYKAKILRLIDADTLTVEVDCGFSIYIEQTLRLRGIDAPELRTQKGAAALRFVKSELADCPFIIIKTYKADKYDRYLTDIFYQSRQNDPLIVADAGPCLNTELLRRGYAIPWTP